MAEILERGLDLLLEKKAPERKRARRLEREERRRAGVARESRPGEISDRRGVEAPSPPARSRYLSSEVRERVLERASHRCEFRGPDGTRCTSRRGLEIEHTKPFAIFRNHDERFLEALCPLCRRRHKGHYADHRIMPPCDVDSLGNVRVAAPGVGIITRPRGKRGLGQGVGSDPAWCR